MDRIPSSLLCRYMLVFVVVVLSAAPDARAITTQDQGPFTVTFYDNGETDGSGTIGQQSWSALQRADVLASLGAWTDTITNIPGRQVSLHMFWDNFSGSTLGGSYNPITGNNTTAWSFAEYVYRQGVNYTLPAGYYSDAKIVYDTDAAGFSWNFGTDTPGGSQIDFRSVITHEVGHTLGFIHTYQSASDTWWAGGLTEMSKGLIDSDGNRPVAGGDGIPGDFDELDDPVYFTGTNAMALYGGQVPIYAPLSYASGSSLSHLNYDTFPNALMSPFISLGMTHRQPTTLEWAMMEDFGWDVVPEPGTMIMLLGMACTWLLWQQRRSLVNRY